MMTTFLPKSKLLSEAVQHHDLKMLYMMAEQLNGGQPTVAWTVKPLVDDAPDLTDAIATVLAY